MRDEISLFLYKETPKILNEKLTKNQQDQILNYLDLLIKWNRKINLTGHKNRKEIFFYLILDSFYLASFFKKINILEPTVLDIGAGAGIPSIPLRILLQKGFFILVESKFKKCVFLKEVINALSLKSIKVLNSRVEELIEKRSVNVDVVMARAFKNIFVVLDLGYKLLKDKGYVVYFSNKSYEKNNIKHPHFSFVKEMHYTTLDKNRFFWLFRKKEKKD